MLDLFEDDFFKAAIDIDSDREFNNDFFKKFMLYSGSNFGEDLLLKFKFVLLYFRCVDASFDLFKLKVLS